MKFPIDDIEALVDEADFEAMNDNEVKRDTIMSVVEWARWAHREVFQLREKNRLLRDSIEILEADYAVMRTEAGYE